MTSAATLQILELRALVHLNKKLASTQQGCSHLEYYSSGGFKVAGTMGDACGAARDNVDPSREVVTCKIGRGECHLAEGQLSVVAYEVTWHFGNDKMTRIAACPITRTWDARLEATGTCTNPCGKQLSQHCGGQPGDVSDVAYDNALVHTGNVQYRTEVLLVEGNHQLWELGVLRLVFVLVWAVLETLVPPLQVDLVALNCRPHRHSRFRVRFRGDAISLQSGFNNMKGERCQATDIFLAASSDINTGWGRSYGKYAGVPVPGLDRYWFGRI
ncbi:hypothetical protein EDB19DRAFT_1830333 [Suillus lakei]|nr:hypothetical protein EDB19DRAFT_1830333 [Suillus lakei]